MPSLKPLNLQQWIEAHRDELRPPVGNKLLYGDGEFLVMAVGGPNARKDFHVDPAEELFYQIEGRMTLRVREGEHIIDVPIAPGELLRLPARVPHSPQRPAGSVGVVVERRRRAGEIDGLQWYCEHCEALLYEEFMQLTDIERQFPPVFARFFGDPALRTCRRCGSVMQPPTLVTPADGTQ
ncbi:MAG TPA: 3-hydroxyanthranilate 3,4-dioxygenase [Steroidobacteraceae bacterium]|nr:3-hydroxyanthranilate 3,4-dioxygenase [Steroidobacteraceae bacterium]